VGAYRLVSAGYQVQVEVWGGPAVVYESPVQLEAVPAATPVVAVDVGVGELALTLVHCTVVHQDQDADDDDVYE
jgi:hypothetical protein